MNKQRWIPGKQRGGIRSMHVLMCCLIVEVAFAQQMDNRLLHGIDAQLSQLYHPRIVVQLVQQNAAGIYWLSNGENPRLIRTCILRQLDSAAIQGLDKRNYHPEDIDQIDSSSTFADSVQRARKLALFADAVISYCLDMSHGRLPYNLLSYDELSPLYQEKENAFLVQQLSQVRTPGQFLDFIRGLEPANSFYANVKSALAAELLQGGIVKIKALSTSLNYYRWINHFHFDRYVLVNICSAQLYYFEHDSLTLTMKVIVGKPATPTPRIGTQCKDIIVYPYWNVPRKIALKEILPRLKKSTSILDEMNLQVLDLSGHVVDAQLINWSQFNSGHFPYNFRQSTGCDNSLGVLKFNLTSPYDVYMHDTNLKEAFLKTSRYLSHGCIRIEKPVELANALVGSSLDSNFVKACLKDQQPRTLQLPRALPVLVVYILAEPMDNQQIEFERDVYHLLP